MLCGLLHFEEDDIALDIILPKAEVCGLRLGGGDVRVWGSDIIFICYFLV